MRVICHCGRRYDMVPPEPELPPGTRWHAVLVVTPHERPPDHCCWDSAYSQGFAHRASARAALLVRN